MQILTQYIVGLLGFHSLFNLCILFAFEHHLHLQDINNPYTVSKGHFSEHTMLLFLYICTVLRYVIMYCQSESANSNFTISLQCAVMMVVLWIGVTSLQRIFSKAR